MKPEMSPEEWAATLEKMRRSVDLRLDFEGNWYHEGEIFEHERLIALFNKGIDSHPDSGEPIVHIGERWCYFKADDTPFIVRRMESSPDALLVELNNGETHPVPPTGFEAVGDYIYVQLTEDRRARLDRGRQNQLWGWLVDEDGSAVVVTASGRYPIVS